MLTSKIIFITDTVLIKLTNHKAMGLLHEM